MYYMWNGVSSEKGEFLEVADGGHIGFGNSVNLRHSWNKDRQAPVFRN